jgi:ACT domain-containing protein
MEQYPRLPPYYYLIFHIVNVEKYPISHTFKKDNPMKAIITVVGKDQVGIIAAVSAGLAEVNVNILDISQTIMQEHFTMMMNVDLAGSAVSLKELKARLADIGGRMGLAINIYNEELFNSMHRV